MQKTVDIVGLPQMAPDVVAKLWTQIIVSIGGVDPVLKREIGLNMVLLPIIGVPADSLCVRIHTDNFNDVGKIRSAFEKVSRIRKGTKISFVHVPCYAAGSIFAKGQSR
jgi:hypothetical protein